MPISMRSSRLTRYSDTGRLPRLLSDPDCAANSPNATSEIPSAPPEYRAVADRFTAAGLFGSEPQGIGGPQDRYRRWRHALSSMTMRLVPSLKFNGAPAPQPRPVPRGKLFRLLPDRLVKLPKHIWRDMIEGRFRSPPLLTTESRFVAPLCRP